VSQPATIEGARSIVEDLLDLRAEARAWSKTRRAFYGGDASRSAYLEATRRLLAAIDATGEP
jgi:hypothetical protein